MFKDILLDEPFKVRVEKLNKIGQNSLFKEVYAEAAQNAFKIIVDADKNTKNDKQFYYEINDYNNIISFTGDRGTGKTSAMISFAKALENHNEFVEGDVLYPQFNKIIKYNCNFTCLKVIEPSNFINHESLFEIVISNIFSQLKEIVDYSNKCIDKNDLKKIYEIFDEVYSALKAMYSEKKDLLDENYDIGSGLEKLEQLSIGKKLKNSFQILVNEYLKFHNRYKTGIENNTKKTFLIIPIDDLDMNMKNSFEMAEEIRKYLITDNIIITMAINIGQFTKIVQQEYIKSFKELVDKGLMIDDPADLAAKYLTKFIPTNRRISLPTFDTQSIADKKEINSDGQYESLVDFFLGRIYNTTGILLLKNETNSHEIIPTNLRELNYLNKLLEDMENVHKEQINILYKSRNDEKARDKLSRNLSKFEDYFINNFINSKMPEAYSKILLELFRQDSENINKYLVRSLLKRHVDINSKETIIDTNEKNGNNQLILEMGSADSLPQNISIGDILFILQQLITDKSDYETRRFVAGIKIIYSIRVIRHIFIEKSDKRARVILGEFLYNVETTELIARNREMIQVSNVRNDSFLKDLLKNIRFNLLISRFTMLDTVFKDSIIKRSAYRRSYDSFYEFPYTPGATNNIVFNLTSFIVNLLHMEIVNDRLKGSSIIHIPKEYYEWKNDYIAVLPLWSIDFIDIFFNIIRKKSDLKVREESGYINHVDSFLKGISLVIKDITDENKYLDKNRLIEAYEKNPVLSPTNLMNPEVKFIIEQLGRWFSGETIGENDKKTQFNEPTKNNGINDSDYAGTKPNEVLILGQTFQVRSWAELLITVIGRVCDQSQENYIILKNSRQLNQLHISTEEIIPKQKRKRIISRNVKDIFVKTNFNVETILNLCRVALVVTGNDPQNDFRLLSIQIKNKF